MQRGSSDRRVYEAAKVHAMRRGIDLSEWPNQQALAPDECRWMREAIEASGYPAEVERLRDAIEEYALWEPGRAGHAAAHRKLLAVARAGRQDA